MLGLMLSREIRDLPKSHYFFFVPPPITFLMADKSRKSSWRQSFRKALSLDIDG